MPIYHSTDAGTTVWPMWVNEVMTPTSVSTSVIDVWPTWVSSTYTTTCTTTASTSTSMAWTYWTNELRTRSQEEILDRLNLERVQREQAERMAEATRKRAEDRAEKLLVENLDQDQYRDWVKARHFIVHGRNHRYRVRKGRMGNVDVIDAKGILTHRLCCHPSHAIPDYDTMLAQKLLLEADEELFLRTANRHQPLNTNERVLEPA